MTERLCAAGMTERNAASTSSKILLSVDFSDNAYFAGEELSCRITLKNVYAHRKRHIDGKIQFGNVDLGSGNNVHASQVTNAIVEATSNAGSARSADGEGTMSPAKPDSTLLKNALASNGTKSIRHVSFANGSNQSPTISTDDLPVQINVTDREDNSPPITDLHIRTKDLLIDPVASTPASPLSKSNTPQSPVVDSPTARQAERLMMGFVQIVGKFTVDESLVHSEDFNEVRKAALVGGKLGGGVVGVDFAKQQQGGGLMSSLYGGLGGLFGSAQKSSMADMKLQTDSKSVPIISTVPSLLFVDLSLDPKTEQSFDYKFKLPSTIPPTHHGLAIQITYSLVLTIQRSNASIAKPKSVEVPFRIFAEIPSKLTNISRCAHLLQKTKAAVDLTICSLRLSILKILPKLPPRLTQRITHLHLNIVYYENRGDQVATLTNPQSPQRMNFCILCSNYCILTTKNQCLALQYIDSLKNAVAASFQLAWVLPFLSPQITPFPHFPIV